jgi:hypothetical protein
MTPEEIRRETEEHMLNPVPGDKYQWNACQWMTVLFVDDDAVVIDTSHDDVRVYHKHCFQHNAFRSFSSEDSLPYFSVYFQGNLESDRASLFRPDLIDIFRYRCASCARLIRPNTSVQLGQG